MSYYACFDIGGTEIKYGILSEKAEIIEKSSMQTNAEKGPEVWMKNIVRVTEQMKSSFNICGICVSSTAMIDPDNGMVVYSLPKMSGYTGFKIKEYLEKECNLICEVENDVNCMVLAEAVSGAGRGFPSVLGVTIGTGVGGGFYQNGTILHGATYSACEIGYIKTGVSDLEHTGSTKALCSRVASAKGDSVEKWDGRKVFDYYRFGDVDCINAIDDMASSIATGLASLSYVLNPHVIILGGGIMNEQSLLERIKNRYSESVTSVLAENTKIVRAQYGNDAGMIGALYHFLQKH